MTAEQLPLVDVRTASGRRSRMNTGMSEAQLLAAVRQLAKYRNWWTYHTAFSRGSEAGWPDLVLISPAHGRTIFAELKREDGKLTASQQAWLTALADCGHETAVWRPSHLADGTITAALRGTRRLTSEGTRRV